MPIALRSLAGVWVASLLAVVSVAATPSERLVDAVKAQDHETVRALLKQGVDVNAPQADGATALHWAAHWDDRETAELLIRAGAQVNAGDDQGVTPLFLACTNASAQMAELLLNAGADTKAARLTGVTPLMMASRTGNSEVVTLLLAHGADVNATEATHGQSALMWAVGENHLEVMRVLLENGANVSARTPASELAARECCLPNYVGGFTPLLFAVQYGNVEAARLLLSAGANVNETMADGSSALVLAIDSAPVVGERVSASAVSAHAVQEAMAEFLLENGADPNHNGAGRTALHSAVQRKMPDLVKTLLAHGANPNARLEKPLPPLSRFIGQQTGLEVSLIGATPFWLAASYGDVATMRSLVAGGADPNLKSNDNTTPLMVAAGVDFSEGQDKYGVRWFQPDSVPLQLRALDAIKLCLELGDDINAANDKGQTAIFGAVYFGGAMLAQFLVENGANMNVKNKRGQTPWLVSQGEYRAGSFYTHKETGELLEKLGADTKLGVDLGREALRQPAR